MAITDFQFPQSFGPVADPPKLPVHEPPVNIEYLTPLDVRAATLLGYNLTEKASSWTSESSLENIGNTCYLNAVLHALASVPRVRVWLRQHCEICAFNDTTAGTACVLCSLARDVECMASSQSVNLYVPEIVRARALWSSGNFANTRQHDASEAFSILADALNEVDHKVLVGQAEEDAGRNKFTNSLTRSTPMWEIFLWNPA